MSGRAITGLLGRLHAQDVRALGYLVARRHRRLDSVMGAVTHLGDPPVVVLVTLALFFAPAEALHMAGVRAAAALVASHVMVQILKRTIARSRPHLPVGVTSLIQPPDRFSFPSGHAAAALSVAGGVATGFVLPLALVLLVLGLLVGVSRCYLGVHYPGDVLAGWILGGAGVVLAVL